MPIRRIRPRVTSPYGFRYITSIHASGRYFLDQYGSPIMVKGASYWALTGQTIASEAVTLFAHLKAYGHNACIITLVNATNSGCNQDGTTFDGIAPFTTFPTLNSTYWARVDAQIAAARDAGVTVFMNPWDFDATHTGGVFASASTTNCQTYGTTIANRYPFATYPNIVWFFGNDYFTDTTNDNRYGAALTGIRSAGDARPMTIMLNYDRSLSTDSTFWESRATFNTVYDYYVQYEATLASYRRTAGARDPRPALFTESRYENDTFFSVSGEPSPNTVPTRQQECWALTSGSPGAFYGNNDWRFNSGWASRLTSYPAETSLASVRRWLSAQEWWKLVPDDAASLVTAGRGTQITSSANTTRPWENDWVTAAYDPAGTFGLVYVPTNSTNSARTITLNLTRLGANLVSRWVDPTDATQVQTATINGSNQTTTPAAHSDGARDWFLWLTADPL